MKQTTILSLPILGISLIILGVVIGVQIAKVKLAEPVTRNPQPVTRTDSTLAPAIHRLTDAVDSLRISQERESDQSQAIWEDIRDKHYSPY